MISINSKSIYIICILIFLIPFNKIIAQPGYPPTQYLNLNNYSIPVIEMITTRSGGQIMTIGDSGEKEYFIDSSTSTFQYLNSLDKIVLKLNYIPKQLIENGAKLETIYIYSQHYKSSNNKEEAILFDTLFDIELLNDLPKLKHINITGFYVVENSHLANNKTYIDTLKFNKRYGFRDVDIINFPRNLIARAFSFYKTKIRDMHSLKNMTTVKEIEISGNDIHNIPDYLPSLMEKIVIQNCDELNNIENLSLYQNLKSFSMNNCLKVDTFPRSYASNKFEEIYIQIKPENLSKLLAGFSAVKQIDLLNVELYNGLADGNFKHFNISIKSFRLTGSSLGIKTKIKLSNFENCTFDDVLLAGCFDGVPLFTEQNRIKNFDFYCYDNMLNNENSKALWQLQGLEKFAIHNFAISKIPESFFEQNSNLTYFTIEATNIKKLSFGKIVLPQLKQLSVRNNKSLVKIPDCNYFPNAYLDSYLNKTKFTRE